ncbi:MAG: Flp family type IVb pilin [Chloroflexota bacterium]|nr:Flp family type IVb pilin [Chloroflexota bacterium]
MEKVQELYTRMMVELSYALRPRQGQGLVEYALIIALVAAALVVVLGMMTNALNGLFTRVAEFLNNANPA